MESGESVSQGRSEDRAVRGFAILRRLHRRAWAAVLSGAACLVFSLVLAVSALGASAGGTAASREATRPRTNTPTSPPITRPRTSALAPKTAELSDPNRVDPRLVYGGLKPAPAEQSPVLEPNDVNLPAEPPVLVAEEEPSAMERLIAGEIDPNVSTQLKQFGYDVFAAPVLTFAPVTDVPVGPDYVIGPGDSFILTLWGRVDAQFLLQVDRNGQVVVPQVGALRVWGMKFSEMEDYLQHELSRKYSDFKMSVAMDRLRVIRVFVVGEASKPGSYTISSLATVINALVAAGGPSKSGSLRNIQLRRNGAEPMTVDLYDFLLGGDRSGDVRLQDGDTIFIPVIGPVVGVAGNVKRPAIYEMAGPMTLGEVLDLAGGATFAGWLQRVQVERIEDHRKRIVVDFDLADRQAGAGRRGPLDTAVHDGDVVKLFPVAARERDIISVEGHVERPGKYEWKPGMRLGDILNSYDVFLPQPNTDYGEIERLVPPDLHVTFVPFNPARVLAGDEVANLELAQYDTIRLFQWDERNYQSVAISGMVFDPNEYRLVPNMRVTDLIDAAGGLKKDAYCRSAEVTRRHITQDGVDTEKLDVDLDKAMAGDPEHNILLRDRDTLVVRPIPELDFNRVVEIQGEVRFPGRYPIRRAETLSSLLERAGGYTEQAYLKGAVFTRESAREVQRKRLGQLIRQLEESMFGGAEQALGSALDAETVKGQQAALDAKKELLARLRTSEITGRVVVKLTPLEQFKATKYDLELEDGDLLVIPRMPGVIHVVGEVFNETSLLYETDGTVSYYLRRVGGMTKDADAKQLSIIKADGSVISRQQNRGKLVFWDNEFNQWSFGGLKNTELDPGDTIVVPRKLDRYFWLKTTKDITQIVFQIAVAAGVVFAI
ncbi:MAG: SLBB domain-containing protein [Sedimentisphaerales bacterium]|jgi:protein involved in polysaccharide export with SLBB domain|nr:SLBB domain-containing protein [Sedimentisphaerales bacterium]HNY79271.1 SLBB domain-containing protein [Sedimentisphaerales bacterium]HOC64531.1 SLBB domain-containing protein [Sedimentisphaerales bacterium]HOH63394.1 SLBB domain-containing protein [Sedimentisphaerales bacterium]HQA89066.1 SLBB domain-containing protein [Sedimentisphaerales bacterium]